MNRWGINVVDHGCVYDNPTPHVCSRHAYFPGLCVLPTGRLLCLMLMGEAFEAENLRPHATHSDDGGRTWSPPLPMSTATVDGVPVNDALKPTVSGDGLVVAAGYRIYRDHRGMGIGNPATNGVQRSVNIATYSTDAGETWAEAEVLALGLSTGLENSGAATLLHGGDLISGGPVMPLWDGSHPDGVDGHLMRSRDHGRSWELEGTYFAVAGHRLTPYETRFCELAPGRLMAITWTFDLEAARSLNNHVLFSSDAGATWTPPLDTGVPGQASNVLRLDADTVLSVHCQREAGDIGLFARVVDVAGDGWRELACVNVWDRAESMAVTGYGNMSGVRFGQPGVTQLPGDELLVTHWAIEGGQGRILSHRLQLDGEAAASH